MTTLRYPSNITKAYLIKLSLPIFLSNLAIPMVGIIDTALMGHLTNEDFLVATSLGSSIILMIFWSFGFLRMGTVGMVSQNLGKGDYREIVYIVLRNLLIALCISIILLMLFFPIIYIIGFFFQISDDVKILVEQYILIRLFSSPAELTLYVLIGFFLGLQLTNISSIIAVLFSILNILLSIILVTKYNLNILGVAYGTLISAYIVSIFFLVITFFYIKKRFKITPRFKLSIFTKKKVLRLLTINFDIFLRTVCLTFAFLWINFLSSKINQEFIAVNTILLHLLTIAAFFLDAYAYSAEGVIGYTVGKKSEKSFLLTVSNSIQLSFITGLIIGVFYIFFSKDIINLITNLDIMRYHTYEYLFWLVLLPPIASICYQLDGIFIGATETKSMRNSTVVSVALYLLISTIFVELFGNHGIWMSVVCLMFFRSITLYLQFGNIIRKF